MKLWRWLTSRESESPFPLVGGVGVRLALGVSAARIPMMKHFVKCSLQTYFCLFPKKLKTNKQLNSGWRRCRGSKEDTKEITPYQHLHSWNSTAGFAWEKNLSTSLRSTVTCFHVHLMVVVWSPWFGIRSGVPSNNPVHNSKPNGPNHQWSLSWYFLPAGYW